jgi:hypothetical protein
MEQSGSFGQKNAQNDFKIEQAAQDSSVVLNLPQVVLEADSSTGIERNNGGPDSPESGSIYSDEIPSGYNSGEQYDTLSTG